MYEKLLIDLRDVLATLYDSETDARRIASDARLPIVFIDFSSNATAYWSQIVKEAERRSAIRALIDTALREYPTGDYAEELHRIRQGFSWFRERNTMSGTSWNEDQSGPGDLASERLIALEIKVQYLIYAVFGLYVGMFILGLLIMLRT